MCYCTIHNVSVTSGEAHKLLHLINQSQDFLILPSNKATFWTSSHGIRSTIELGPVNVGSCGTRVPLGPVAWRKVQEPEGESIFGSQSLLGVLQSWTSVDVSQALVEDRGPRQGPSPSSDTHIITPLSKLFQLCGLRVSLRSLTHTSHTTQHAQSGCCNHARSYLDRRDESAVFGGFWSSGSKAMCVVNEGLLITVIMTSGDTRQETITL